MPERQGYHLDTLGDIVKHRAGEFAGKALLQIYGMSPMDMVTIVTPIHGVSTNEQADVVFLTEDGLDHTQKLVFRGATPVLRNLNEVGDMWFSPDGFTKSQFGIQDMPAEFAAADPHIRAYVNA